MILILILMIDPSSYLLDLRDRKNWWIDINIFGLFTIDCTYFPSLSVGFFKTLNCQLNGFMLFFGKMEIAHFYKFRQICHFPIYFRNPWNFVSIRMSYAKWVMLIWKCVILIYLLLSVLWQFHPMHFFYSGKLIDSFKINH